jgi:uroporphyrinogen-III decarboxylase
MGNVDCGLLDRGSNQQVTASTRYALRHGMPGGGYVFSTSNCICTGMPLERYELMLQVCPGKAAVQNSLLNFYDLLNPLNNLDLP